MNGGIGRLVEAVRDPARSPLRVQGRVSAVAGDTLEVQGLALGLGAIVEVATDAGPPLTAEVVGFHGAACVAMPLGEIGSLAPGARVWQRPGSERAPDPDHCLGRVLDGLGRPLDGGPLPKRLAAGESVPSRSCVLSRSRIREPLDVGVRSINALTTIGRGARVGLFAGAGIGKSTLLGQIARFTEAEAVVLALIGERGREVRDFIEGELGEARERLVAVVATSDEPALLRRRAALLAADLAATLRHRGRHVLLLMDSLTRFCTAQREIGLAAGEPPATRGYPPSVWSTLPRLLERAGTGTGRGSVTGIYTVLVEGNDLDEPVADAARSLLDGHVVLSRARAERGDFPPVDPLESVSRLMGQVADAEHLHLARRARELLASHAAAQDLIRFGAYVRGADPEMDEAVRLEPALRAFLRQAPQERCDLPGAREELRRALSGGAA